MTIAIAPPQTQRPALQRQYTSKMKSPIPDYLKVVLDNARANDDGAPAHYIEPLAKADTSKMAVALAMVFKLVESGRQRWRAVNAPHLVALVRAGARFERGHLVERSESHAA